MRWQRPEQAGCDIVVPEFGRAQIAPGGGDRAMPGLAHGIEAGAQGMPGELPRIGAGRLGRALEQPGDIPVAERLAIGLTDTVDMLKQQSRRRPASRQPVLDRRHRTAGCCRQRGLPGPRRRPLPRDGHSLAKPGRIRLGKPHGHQQSLGRVHDVATIKSHQFRARSAAPNPTISKARSRTPIGLSGRVATVRISMAGRAGAAWPWVRAMPAITAATALPGKRQSNGGW